MKRLAKLAFSLLLLVGISAVVTYGTSRDSDTDPDLGIATSELSLSGAIVWSLPLSGFVWLACLLVIWIIRKAIRIVSFKLSDGPINPVEATADPPTHRQ